MSKKRKSKTAPPRTEVLILDDHPVFRRGLAQVINAEKDLHVCGEARDAEQCLQAIPKLNPDVVLVDISLPGKNGLEFIKTVRLANKAIKLLVVSMHDEALYANRVLRAGGDGYVMKEQDPEEIVHAIRDVVEGHIYVSEEILTKGTQTDEATAERSPQGLDQLTDLELEVLELISGGQSDGVIASSLKLDGAGAVGRLRNSIQKKLRLRSQRALLRYAVTWSETGAEYQP
jgi:DNA-binding NarL/FixJ family response regulator